MKKNRYSQLNKKTKIVCFLLLLIAIVLFLWYAKKCLEESAYQARMEKSFTISKIGSYARTSKEYFKDCSFPVDKELAFPNIFYINNDENEGWSGPYIIETPIQEKPLDTWGVPIKFIQQKQRLEIRSSGPDKKFGNSDDIVAFVEEKNGNIHSYWLLPKALTGREI